MMIVRHAEFRDLEDIYKLAGKSGVGLTSLPQKYGYAFGSNFTYSQYFKWQCS